MSGADLQLLAQTGDSRRIPRAVQGRQSPHRPRYRRLPSGARHTRRRGQRGRRPYLQPEGLRPDAGHRRAHRSGGEEGVRLPEAERGPVSEDDRLLRGHGTRRAHAEGADQREQRPLLPVPALRDADHRQRQRGARAIGSQYGQIHPGHPARPGVRNRRLPHVLDPSHARRVRTDD